MVVMKEQRGIIVGDPNLADRLGLGRDVWPQPNGIEHLVRTVTDCRAAPVEIVGEQCRGILPIDDRDHEPRAGARHTEQQPRQPAAGD